MHDQDRTLSEEMIWPGGGGVKVYCAAPLLLESCWLRLNDSRISCGSKGVLRWFHSFQRGVSVEMGQ